MARTSPRQRKTAGRVMHEFKHGELKSGPRGKGGRVKSRRQAIAIALKEAGASRNEGKTGNRHNLARSKRKEARGETAQQRTEGRSAVGSKAGARGRKTRAVTSKRRPARRSAAASRHPASRRASAPRKRVSRSRSR